MYPNVELHIGGAWRGASGGGTLPVLNPATAEPIGTHPVATREDLDAALEAAKRGFKAWKATSAYDRYKIMRKAADLLRERADDDRQDHDARAGQAAARGQDGGARPAPTPSTGSPKKAGAPMAASSRAAPKA